MTKLNSWNEYDPLKTVILGKIYSNDRIPKLYSEAEQEYFVKIVNETNKELENFETVLKQNNIKVLRPTQPETINETSIYHTDPLINVRDFHMVYGNLFFITYGPYNERRFTSLWLENVINELIADNNLIVSANELNLENKTINEYEPNLLSLEKYYELKFGKKLKVKNKKNFYDLLKKLIENNGNDDWFIKHNFNNSNKNTFHTASILKMNNNCFISQFSGTEIGKKWIKNWLQTLEVNLIELPAIGHIDGDCTIINHDSIITYTHNTIFDNFFQKIYYVDMDQENYKKYQSIARDEIFVPSLYYKKWQPLFNNLRKSTNGLTIKPNVVILSFYDKDFYKKLKNDGIEAIYVKWSHGKFWEGGLHCITLDIERRPE